MTAEERDAARADIEGTDDLLERAMKLADLRDFKVLPQLQVLKEEVADA